MNDFNTFVIVEEVVSGLEADKYPKSQKCPMDIMKNVENDPLQVRLIKIADKARVKNIVERYSAEEDKPIIIVINENGSFKWLIDGHHRLSAHVKMKSTFVNTIEIPFIDLYNSKSAAIKLGHKMNVNVVDKEECSNSDIKALIKADAQEGERVDTPDYIRDLAALYTKNPNGIGRLVQAVIHGEGLIERPLTAEEASDYAEQVRTNNPDAAVYHTHSRVIHEQGVGALMSRMYKTGKTRGILLAYHPRMDHKKSHADKLSIAEETAKYLNIDITVLDMGFEKKDEYK